MSAGQTERIQRLGKYEIVETIGRGGFGVVYKGFDPALRRFVAIKTCNSERQEVRRRFEREARISGRLDHPNVVRTYDSGAEGELPFLVQEYLPGEDLDRQIARGNAGSDRRKISCLIQIARGLRYAHDRGVVHRDVKPANIRILPGGTAKLLDFGIARVIQAASELTRAGTTVGTAAYLAPEQIRGQPVDHRTDVFAFGVTAYELLTGHRPFGGGTISAIYYQILNEQPEPMAALWPACPRELAELIRRCLDKEPHRRYGSFAEIAERLTSIERRGLAQTSPAMRVVTDDGPWHPPSAPAGLGDMPLRTPSAGLPVSASRPQPPAPRPRRRALWLLALPLAALTAAGIVAVERPRWLDAARHFAARLPAAIAELASESAAAAGLAGDAPIGAPDATAPATPVGDSARAAVREAATPAPTPVTAPSSLAAPAPPDGSAALAGTAVVPPTPGPAAAGRSGGSSVPAPARGLLTLQPYLGGSSGYASVDGELLGPAPFARRPFAPGRHRLEIAGAAGQPPRLEATIDVLPGQETVVTFDLAGVRPLLVRTRR